VSKKVTDIAQKTSDAAIPTDKLIKKVVVSIGGKEWPMVITINVIIECERSLGINLMDDTQPAWIGKLSFEISRELLYLALKHAGAQYTREELGGGLVGPGNMRAVNTAIGQAWLASMPDPAPKAEDENPTAAAQ
jgi:hypothetical protein